MNKILSFVNRLESYKTKFKNLHWSAINNSMHIRVDEYLDILSNYQDLIAEQGLGVDGLFGPNDVETVKLNYIEPYTSLQELIRETLIFHTEVKGYSSYIGIVNSTEDFLQESTKYLYLFKLCEKG